MIKKLWPQARPYAPWILAGILCSAAEAVFELLIPLVMSDIVDIGNKLKMPPRFNEPYQELLEEFRNTTLFPVTSVINKIFQLSRFVGCY